MDHNKLWKILKVMGIPDDLSCLLRNLYAGQEATVIEVKELQVKEKLLGKRIGPSKLASPLACSPSLLTLINLSDYGFIF